MGCTACKATQERRPYAVYPVAGQDAYNREQSPYYDPDQHLHPEDPRCNAGAHQPLHEQQYDPHAPQGESEQERQWAARHGGKKIAADTDEGDPYLDHHDPHGDGGGGSVGHGNGNGPQSPVYSTNGGRDPQLGRDSRTGVDGRRLGGGESELTYATFEDVRPTSSVVPFASTASAAEFSHQQQHGAQTGAHPQHYDGQQRYADEQQRPNAAFRSPSSSSSHHPPQNDPHFHQHQQQQQQHPSSSSYQQQEFQQGYHHDAAAGDDVEAEEARRYHERQIAPYANGVSGPSSVVGGARSDAGSEAPPGYVVARDGDATRATLYATPRAGSAMASAATTPGAMTGRHSQRSGGGGGRTPRSVAGLRTPMSGLSDDGELVLVCADCYAEIDDTAPAQCPVTGKMHT